MTVRTCVLGAITAACLATSFAARGAAQTEKLQGTTYRSPSGTTLRLMLDESNVGPAGAKAVVVWVPGDEGKKIAARWKKEP